MIYTAMLQEIERHVTLLFRKNGTEKLLFHNLERTGDVLKRAAEIARHLTLSDKDRFILLSAIWFYNTGHLFDDTEAYIVKSVDTMHQFFKGKPGVEPGIVQKIEKLIYYTTYNRSAENILEEILHDADTYYVGTEQFKKLNKCHRKEQRLKGNIKEATWQNDTLTWLQQHNFYSAYCRNLLEQKKKENIKELVQKSSAGGSASLPEESKSQQASQIKGIQTMMRVMNDNHLEFSSIADNKANLLISVNAIMLSIVLSMLTRRLDADPYLRLPTIIFLVVSVSTIVLAILSTRPKVTSGYFTRDDVLNRKINLMFFGNYHKTKVEDYEWGMRKLMSDPDYMYGTMIRDVHQLGVVLARKYWLIGAAYNVFMYGIVLTVLAFVYAIIFLQPTDPALTPL